MTETGGDRDASAVRRALERGRGDRRGGVGPWMISAGLHAALVLAGGFVVWQVAADRDDEPPRVEVSFTDPSLGERRTSYEITEHDTADAVIAPPAPVEIADTARPEVASAAPAPPPRFDDAPAPPRRPRVGREKTERAVSLDAPVRRAAVEFAGADGGDARDVVYVVDASGSMVSSMPIVKRMLTASVSRLDPTQRYAVVFFKGGSFVGESGGALSLRRASASNLRRTVEWAGGVTPGGLSDPVGAVRAALSVEPDVVFVLSSAVKTAGRWEPNADEVMAALDAANPAGRTGDRKVRIEAIQFLRPDVGGLLRRIGNAHGAYRLLSRAELDTLRNELRDGESR